MLLFGLLVPVLGVVAEVAGEVVPPPGDAVSVQYIRGLGRVRHPGTVGFKTFKYCETWGHHHTWCQRTQGWHRLQRGEETSYFLSALVWTDAAIAEVFISLTFCHMCRPHFWDRDDILAKLTSQYGIFQFAIHALMFVFNFSCQKYQGIFYLLMHDPWRMMGHKLSNVPDNNHLQMISYFMVLNIYNTILKHLVYLSFIASNKTYSLPS